MKSQWQAIVLAALIPLLGSTSCTMATVERNFRRGSREIARDFSRLGRQLERGFDNLFDSRPARHGSYRPAAYRSSSTSSRSQTKNNASASPVAARPAEHPFATSVPGRSGFVKLPGREDLPEVDVRGIPSGTSIEVPDAAGGSIGFRVP
jgi:hypothetical protein